MKRQILLLLVGVSASACATLPTSQATRGIEVKKIVDRTKCELASIMHSKEYAPVMKDWSAKVSLDLKVLYDNSGGPSGLLIVPFHAGTVEAGGALGAAAQSNRAGHLAYNVSKLQDLKNIPYEICLNSTGIPFSPETLGLKEWLEIAVASVTRGKDYVDLSELTYLLEFIVEQSASGEVRIRSSTGPTTGTAALGGKASAKDSNTLLVSLVPPSPPPPGPTKISIVNWPKTLPNPAGRNDKSTGLENFRFDDSVSDSKAPAVETEHRQVKKKSSPVLRGVDGYTQQRLDDLQVKQRLFNSITVPRSTLNAF